MKHINNAANSKKPYVPTTFFLHNSPQQLFVCVSMVTSHIKMFFWWVLIIPLSSSHYIQYESPYNHYCSLKMKGVFSLLNGQFLN